MIVFLNGYFKICSYSFCEELGRRQAPLVVQFAAPETLTHNQIIFQSQIFSAGIIFYKLLTGRFPLELSRVEHFNEAYNEKKKLELTFPKNTDPAVQELISACLEVDHQNRISLNSLKEKTDRLAKNSFTNILQHRKTLMLKLKEANNKIR